MEKKFPIGIMLFSIYFIVDSLIQLYVKLIMPNYYFWYSWLFQPLPEHIIFLRYLLSIIFRIFELILGIGLLSRSETFRKLALFIGWFTIIIVYWKHPFDVLVKHMHIVIKTICQVSGFNESTLLPFVRLMAWISFGCLYALDIGVSVLTIYYFTRPYIREQFKQ